MNTAIVVGMARSGIASAKLLHGQGWHVILSDSKADIPGIWEALPRADYEDALGKPVEDLLAQADLMVLSPGVPMRLPFVQAARERGIEVIGEIELGWRYSSGEFWCISGTNGKTTCTALAGELFKAGGRHTYVLGNIGDPITAHATDTKPGDVIVAETAALQLEGNQRFHAHGAAMCNITEDHLDRFLTMENYIAAKERIFERQTPQDYAILNYDDPIVQDMARLTPAHILYFSRKQAVSDGVWCVDGETVRYCINGVPGTLCRAQEIRIPGAHNLENAMLCAAMALAGGIPADTVRQTLMTFPGVEHRIEYVCTRKGVTYINDSKGTNPDSTIKAVAAMTAPTVLLLGGYDKHNAFDELFASFGGKVKAVVALGVTAPKILAAAKAAGFSNIRHCTGSFEEATEMARDIAQPGDAVLLSPACASWDMFRDYEQRGEVFKRIVQAYAE